MFNADQMILGKTVREHIGGRWAISLIAFVVNAPLNLVSIMSNASAGESQRVSPLWWLVALLGYTAFGVVLWLASATLFRNRRVVPVPVWWVVALGFLAGGVRGVVVGFGAQAFDLATTDVSLLLTRVFTGAFLGAILLPVAALSLSIISTYRREREKLLDEKVEAERVALHNSGISDSLRSALLESVREDVQNIRTSHQARELSHRIWEQDVELKEPAVSWWRVVRTSFTMNPYATVPVVLLWSVSAIGTLSVSIGLTRAVAQILLSSLFIVGAFWIGHRLNRVAWLPGAIVFIGVMAISVLLTSFVASWIFDPRPWPSGAGLAATNAVWLPFLTLVVGVVITAIRSSESVIYALESEVSDAELTQVATAKESEELRKALAAELHGSVQSQLLISAALHDNPELAKIAQISGGAIRIDAQKIFEQVDEQSVTERLTTIVSQWRGLMSVNIEWMGNELPVQQSDAVARVFEEGLSNAFRHGKASEVNIHVTVFEDSFMILIEDEGIGLSSEFMPGLGLRVIDSLAPLSCELSNGATHGCVLKVEFRLGDS